MNTYLIEHKIETLAELWTPTDTEGEFQFRGFKFKQWDFTLADGALGNAWVAHKEIQANNVIDALNNFQSELFDIVRRISFVSQCFAIANIETYFILRINDNPKNTFFLSRFDGTGSVPLHFEEDEKESLKNLEAFKYPIAFEYISQSTRSATYTTRLAMLLIALESIAGEVSPGRTDKDYIRDEILQEEELYDEIFQWETGVRNKIFHGKEVTYTKDYSRIIYDKIVSYFNRKYKTKINTDVASPQRVPFGNYRGTRAWFMPQSDFSTWDLKKIIDRDENDKKMDDRIVNGTFLHIVSAPKEY